MKKFFLLIFILIDLAVISAAAIFLRARIKGEPIQIPMLPTALSNVLPGGVQRVLPTSMTSVARPMTPPPASVPAVAAVPAAPPMPPNSRKILFSYKNSKPHRVMIRADFTGWKEEPMVKDAASEWKYTAVLEPGEYAYCFSIDNKKPIKDPSNKRTKKVGTTFVSSIVVAPAPASR